MNPNFLPEHAPLDASQREWVNAFIANLLPDHKEVEERENVPVTILWGSQTGNSEGLAKKLAKALKGCETQVIDMAQYAPEQLAKETNLLVITSTYGDGEPPDNAEALHAYIMSEEASRIEGVNFSVFALGDAEYPDFCLCGKQFDERLESLGGSRLLARVDCDVEFDDEFIQWRNELRTLFSTGGNIDQDEEAQEEQPYGKQNPFPSPILKKFNLNSSDSERETYHLELSLEGSDLSYEAGDALGVMPINDEQIVNEILDSLPFRSGEEVPLPNKKEGTLKEALLYHYDLRTITKKLLIEWQKRSGSPYLRALVEADSAEQYQEFIWGRELVDLVVDYPASFTDAEEFVSILRRMTPRLYSISSSPNAHPNEVHLTVAIVRYHAHYRNRQGVCSTFLSDRSEGLNPGVFVHSNKAFRLPEDKERPVIMVGPGTGIAPFRAFLEERKASQASGSNWLFFGNPHRTLDFLYENELSKMQEDGVLTRLDLAFSRDQAEKIYVQDRMNEQGAEIWRWLEQGAYFYVCGDASRMAKDVDQSLHHIIQKQGGKSEEEAADYVKMLKQEKRYARDVY